MLCTGLCTASYKNGVTCTNALILIEVSCYFQECTGQKCARNISDIPDVSWMYQLAVVEIQVHKIFALYKQG